MALHLALLVVGIAFVWWAGGALERSCEALARHYRVPPLVEGTVLSAVGSSFPELSTAVVATLLHGEFDLGVSAIVGSAIFNLVVIPGVCVLAASGLSASAALGRREMPFYLVSIAALGGVFWAARELYPVEGEGAKGEVTRALVVAPLVLYAIYLWFQHAGTQRYREGEDGEVRDRPDEGPGPHWWRLGVGLAAIVGGVELLVRAVLFLGDRLGTPSFLWGATVVAAATSAPDAVVSLRQARSGKASTSLGNVLGSNVFDLLVAIPAGVLIAGTAVVDVAVAGPMMVWLVGMSVLVLALIRGGRELSARDGVVMLASYAAFVVWLVARAL